MRWRRAGVISILALAVALPVTPARTQPVPGGRGWLAAPGSEHGAAAPQMSALDVALVRCLRKAIATGQFFLGDVNYVLAQCAQPLSAWVADCERREGKGAAICLLGPQQAAGAALNDAWAHRNDLKAWLASLPPLPRD
jgi:hypothetical protein